MIIGVGKYWSLGGHTAAFKGDHFEGSRALNLEATLL